MNQYKLNPKCQTKVDAMLPVNYRSVWLNLLDGQIKEPILLGECLAYVVNLFSGQKKYIHVKGYEKGLLMLLKLDVLKKVVDDDI